MLREESRLTAEPQLRPLGQAQCPEGRLQPSRERKHLVRDPAGVGGEQSPSLVSPAQGQTGLCKGLLLVQEMATRDKPCQGAAPRRGMEASHYAPFGISQKENNEKETRTNRQPSGRGPPGHPKWSEEGLWVEGRGLRAQLTGHPALRTACAACRETNQ